MQSVLYSSFFRLGTANSVEAEVKEDEKIGDDDHDDMQVNVSNVKDAGGMDLEDDAYPQGGTLIYIDNSNIWINTMEHSAKRLEFINDIKQDHRIRVNVNKLLSTASDGRPILRAVLYGSEPPPVERFWNNVKECSFCKVDVQVTNRSTYNNKEKDVDQNIMLDIGEDIVIHQNHAKYGGTLILFTGDGGMIAAVRRAVKYNWNVEVWSYRSSLAKDYVDEAETNEKLTLKYLDDYFNELIFYTLIWKTYLPDERSFVMTFQKIPHDKKSEFLETVIKFITQLVRMPMAGRYIKEKDEKITKSTHLALVCSVGQQILKEDARYINKLPDNNDSTKSKHAPKTPTHQYQNENSNQHRRNSNSNKQSFNLHLSMEQLTKIARLFDWPPEQIDNDMKNSLKTIIYDSVKSTVSSLEQDPKYDFNTDVYSKVETCIGNPVKPEVASEDGKIAFYDVIKRYKPQIRSVPQFLQDMKLDYLSELEDFSKFESPALEDDGEGGFTVYTNRKQRNRFQKYSAPCKYSYRCHNGFKCTYKHSLTEKEFFRIQPNPKLRYSYKALQCEHYASQKCRYRGPMSYMCPFAHGYFCISCRCDEDGGHNIALCPDPHHSNSP